MAKGKEQKSLLIPSFPCETCCNSRIFPILYKFVSFTLTGTTNHILRFFCVVNYHFLVRVASLWLRYEALLQWSPNSSVESRGALSPRVVLVVLPQHKHITLILGILAQGWWNFPAPLESDPNQSMQKPPEMFWQWFTIPRAAGVPGTALAFPVGPLHHCSCTIWDH